LSAQGGNFFGNQAELFQDVGCVLSALWCRFRSSHATAERDGTAKKIKRAEPLVVHPQAHIERFDLGI
jgi:hypothetical protein